MLRTSSQEALGGPALPVRLPMYAAVCCFGGALLIASVAWHWGAPGLLSGGLLLVVGCVLFLTALARDDAQAAQYEARLPRGDMQWPPGCAVCAATPCELEPITTRGAEREVSVPVCREHRGTQAAVLDGRTLKFRSQHAAERFRSLNPG